MLGGILFDVQKSVLTSSASASTTTSSLAFVIGVSAVASLAAAALVAVGVKEVPPQRHTQETKQNDKEMAVASCPLGVSLWAGVATVCVLSFLFNVGDSTFHAFFPSLLKEKLALNTRSIGLAYTVFACISFCVSATIAGQSIQRNGPVSTCALGLSAVGMGLFGLALSQGWWILAAAALYYSGVPLYGPTIPTMLLQCVPSHKRGAVMGLDGAINTVARVVAPLLMGEVYRRAGSAMAFSVAGASVMTGASMACVRRYLVWSQRDNKKDDGDFVVKMKQA
jgi:Na+/melibiose symporter-like transporter